MYILHSVIPTFYNFTHPLISQNPREQMFLFQILLLIVTFLSLISSILSLMQTTMKVNPHLRMHHMSICGVSSYFYYYSSSSYVTCCMDLSHCSRRPSGRLTCEDGSCVMIPQIPHNINCFKPQTLIQNLVFSLSHVLQISRQFKPPMWEDLQGVDFLQDHALVIAKITVYYSRMQPLLFRLSTYPQKPSSFD